MGQSPGRVHVKRMLQYMTLGKTMGGGAKTRHYTLPICADRKMIDKVELIYVGLTIIVVGEHTRQGQSDVREGVNK